ncbi:MAG: hypothetical protein GZ094_12790 [Mariniphaga sp.]|nr:hypothetical protein [Mariniphaga sp.]
MKTEDYSATIKDNIQPESSEKLMGRREVISKAGLFALSATTMMVLMKSQPAMATSNRPEINTYIAPPDQNQTWQRTTRK